MKVSIPKGVVYRELDGEMVLLNLDTGNYYGLDPVGTRMWNLLKEHGTTEKVLETMKEEYEVKEEQLRGDIQELVQKLAAKGLVKADGQKA